MSAEQPQPDEEQSPQYGDGDDDPYDPSRETADNALLRLLSIRLSADDRRSRHRTRRRPRPGAVGAALARTVRRAALIHPALIHPALIHPALIRPALIHPNRDMEVSL